MKFVTIKEESDVELIPLADLHLGSEQCNLRKIEEVIRYIKETKNARVVILGDIFETAIIGSKGSPYFAENLETEFRLAKEILKPIKDRIIGVVSGNHERRVSKAIGFDISKHLCEKLGISDKYSPSFLALRIATPKTAWFIVLHHGVGGGRLKGSKINHLHRFGNIFPNADVIITGHTHDLIVTADKKFLIDKNHNRIKVHTTYYINVPSFLDYGGYAAEHAYPLSMAGAVKIVLRNIVNRIKVKGIKVERVI